MGCCGLNGLKVSPSSNDDSPRRVAVPGIVRQLLAERSKARVRVPCEKAVRGCDAPTSWCQETRSSHQKCPHVEVQHELRVVFPDLAVTLSLLHPRWTCSVVGNSKLVRVLCVYVCVSVRSVYMQRTICLLL